MTVDIHHDIVEELFAHAVEALPREACGVLVGPEDERRYDRLVRMRNVSDSDSDFAFDPAEQGDLWQALEDAGERVQAIYHSHPRRLAYPSPVDVLCAAYEDVDCLIVGQGEPALRAFEIKGRRVSEKSLIRGYGLGAR